MSAEHRRNPESGPSRQEQAVKIAGKLYEARDFIRRMTTPEEYAKRMAQYQDLIRRAMDKFQVDAMAAVLQLAQTPEIHPISQAGLFAAYVEMTEAKTK